jgi:FHS family Na+ dependent glucose MFS transporter 1
MSATPSFTLSKVNKVYATIGYYGAFICLGLSTAALGPTLPGLASNTHSSLELISSLFIGRSLGYMLGSIVGGRFYDRLPGNRLMAAMLTLMAIMIFLVPLTSLLWLLVAVMLLLGFGEGAMDTGGNTLLTRIHSNNLGPYMNGLHFFFGVGTSITPIIIAQTSLRSGQLNWAYWCLALLFIPVILWLFFQTSPAIQMQTRHTTSDANSSRILIWLVAALMFLYVGAEVGYASWIYTYTVKLNLSNTIQAAYLTSLFWGAFTVGRLIAIPIAIRIKAQTILLVDLLGSFISLAAILLFPSSSTVLWISAAGTGLFFASIFPTALVLAEQRMALTGRVTGFLLVGSSLGGMSVPWLVGQLFEPIGPQVMPFVVCVTVLMCFLVFTRLPASSKNKEQTNYETGPSS